MRRSIPSVTLLPSVNPAGSTGRGRLTLALLLLLGLGFWSAGPSTTLATGGSGHHAAGLASAQPGFELVVAAANCQIDPPLPPTLDEAGCAPAVGAVVSAVDETGAELGSCATNLVDTNGQSALCTIVVPYESTGQVYEVTGTIPDGFAPRRNPIRFSAPPVGPVGGLVSYPIFVNLPTGGGNGTEGTVEEAPVQDVDEAEQIDPIQPQATLVDPDHLAIVVTGACAETGDAAAASIPLRAPVGDPIGLPTALIAETGGGALALPLDDLFATPHAIVVIAAGGAPTPTLACGDLGSVADEDGIAVIGLAAVDGSGLAGIAYLTTDPANPAQTLASIFLAEGLT